MTKNFILSRWYNMVDAVKVIADGIRLEKKITKSSEHNYGSKRRSATHDATNIGKDDSAIVINAATGGSDKSAEVKETATEASNGSADRTETNNEPADNAGNTNDKKGE